MDQLAVDHRSLTAAAGHGKQLPPLNQKGNLGFFLFDGRFSIHRWKVASVPRDGAGSGRATFSG